MISHKKLALIHILKRELGLSDEEYRDILYQSTGVNSAKDLTDEAFKNLMSHFVRSNHYLVNIDGFTMKQKLFIQDLANKLNWHEQHLNNFIKKYYHKPHLNRLTKNEASRVIESLKHILDRKNKEI